MTTIRRIVVAVAFLFASTVSIGCATEGKVLRPVSADTYLKVQSFHFADPTISIEFVMKTDGSEDTTSVLIENLTAEPMTVVLTAQGGRIAVFADHILPSGQSVLNVRLPLREWLSLIVSTDHPHLTRIKFDP